MKNFSLYIVLSWRIYITLKLPSLGVEIGTCLFRLTYAPFTLRRRNVKTQQSPVILDLYLWKPRSWKSHGFRDIIVFGEFRNGLVWTVGLNKAIKGESF